jgi:hypothetical protein
LAPQNPKRSCAEDADQQDGREPDTLWRDSEIGVAAQSKLDVAPPLPIS